MKTGIKNQIMIMKDFNSQIGSKELNEELIMGPYNYGKINERGEEIVKFLCTKLSQNYKHFF